MRLCPFMPRKLKIITNILLGMNTAAVNRLVDKSSKIFKKFLSVYLNALCACVYVFI